MLRIPDVPIQYRLLLDEVAAAALCGLEVEAFRSLNTVSLEKMTVTFGKRKLWVRETLVAWVRDVLPLLIRP